MRKIALVLLFLHFWLVLAAAYFAPDYNRGVSDSTYGVIWFILAFIFAGIAIGKDD